MPRRFSRSGLYESLVNGAALGEAVLGARKLVAASRSIDWADYVHYGNPDFRLTLSAAPTATASQPERKSIQAAM